MPSTTFRFVTLLLLCALGVAGALQTFTQYPFQVPDERLHWLAGVSRVNALLPGRDSRCDTLMGLPEHFDVGRIHFNKLEKGTPGKFEASSQAPVVCIEREMNYGFILSYPGVVLALLCRAVIPLSDVSVFFLARFFQGCMLLALLAALARLVLQKSTGLFWRRLFFLGSVLLLFTPIGLQQTFAISADPLVDAFALFVVYLMWVPRLSRATLALYFCIGLAAAITKPPLMAWLLPLGLWLHIERKLVDKSGKIFWIATGAIVAITLWMSAVSVSITVPLPVAVPSEQLAFIKSHPFESLRIFSAGAWGKLVRPGLLSNSLGWLDFGVTLAALQLQKLVHALVFLFFWVPVVFSWRTVKVGLRPVSRASFFADFSLGFGLWLSMMGICFFLYLYWNVPAAPVLDGLQMRYFLCHLLVFAGWLGYRLDKVVPVSYTAPEFPRLVTWSARTFASLVVFAYLVERSFSNLLRYF
jgi:hypothetical protein